MAQRKHLGAELGVGAGADEDQVGEEASELVREPEKHGRESCPIYPTIPGQDRLPGLAGLPAVGSRGANSN